MNLNVVMAFILRYFTEFGSFWAIYVKKVEDCRTYCLRQNVVFGNMTYGDILRDENIALKRGTPNRKRKLH